MPPPFPVAVNVNTTTQLGSTGTIRFSPHSSDNDLGLPPPPPHLQIGIPHRFPPILLLEDAPTQLCPWEWTLCRISHYRCWACSISPLPGSIRAAERRRKSTPFTHNNTRPIYFQQPNSSHLHIPKFWFFPFETRPNTIQMDYSICKGYSNSVSNPPTNSPFCALSTWGGRATALKQCCGNGAIGNYSRNTSVMLSILQYHRPWIDTRHC